MGALAKVCTSTDERLAIELATVKSPAMEREADSRWIAARYQIADGLTKHESREVGRGAAGDQPSAMANHRRRNDARNTAR